MLKRTGNNSKDLAVSKIQRTNKGYSRQEKLLVGLIGLTVLNDIIVFLILHYFIK